MCPEALVLCKTPPVAAKALTIHWMATDGSQVPFILSHPGRGDVKCAVTGRIALYINLGNFQKGQMTTSVAQYQALGFYF